MSIYIPKRSPDASPAACFPQMPLRICDACLRRNDGAVRDSQSRDHVVIDASTLRTFGPECPMREAA